ncbi:MAG: hypothetical protein NTV57_14695 [Cyanobacteria bacterium]|nr:hypothetical protein [Cyanobacteriota bacterium]
MKAERFCLPLGWGLEAAVVAALMGPDCRSLASIEPGAADHPRCPG